MKVFLLVFLSILWLVRAQEDYDASYVQIYDDALTSYINALFKGMDTNQDGMITIDEVPIEYSNKDAFIKGIDTSGDGKISLAEFTAKLKEIDKYA